MGIVKTKNSGFHLSNCSRQKTFRLIYAFWAAVLFCSFLPLQAKELKKITNIYFDSEQSIILESDDDKKLGSEISKSKQGSVVFLLESKAKNLPESLANDKFKITIEESKLKNSENKSTKALKLNIESLEPQVSLTTNLEIVLDGFIHRVNFVPEPITAEQTRQTRNKAHHLKASHNDRFIFALTEEKSPVDELLSKLDTDLLEEIIAKPNFKLENIAKADAASMADIANKLEAGGHKQEAAEAFRESLKVNPQNINAMLGLARTSSDNQEKLSHYLKSLSDEALSFVGKTWLNKGLTSQDPKYIAQALIPYQFAILKNPTNIKRRFEYAQALEQAGYYYYPQASKRYLETAILAKKQFLQGDESKESLLRESTESLIKLLTVQGKQEDALHYCDSYLRLGYKKFLDGEPVSSRIKKIKQHKNPFLSIEKSFVNISENFLPINTKKDITIELIRPNFIDYPNLGEGFIGLHQASNSYLYGHISKIKKNSFEINIDLIKNQEEKKLVNNLAFKVERPKQNSHDACNAVISSSLASALEAGIGGSISSYGIAPGALALVGAAGAALQEHETKRPWSFSQGDKIALINLKRRNK